MFDTETSVRMMNAFVPISRFNKGEAGKIIEEVKQEGIKVIVKNNEPECVMLSCEIYNTLQERANRMSHLDDSDEFEKKRREFVMKIRSRAVPPLSNKTPEERKKIMDSIGMIDVDGEAVKELRRISMI